MTCTRSKNKYPISHDQWIEITHKNGKTVSTFYPPNAEFERLRHECDPPAELIYRRLNFIGGVPLEYLWTEPEPDVRTSGGLYIMRIAIEDWLQVMQHERQTRSEHVLRCTCQPRPVEFGPCPCKRCQRELQEALANQSDSQEIM